jgi:hypothetical protein
MGYMLFYNMKRWSIENNLTRQVVKKTHNNDCKLLEFNGRRM